MLVLRDLIERARSNGFVFEAVTDASGTHGLSILVDDEHFMLLFDEHPDEGFLSDLFLSDARKVCFDSRDVTSLCMRGVTNVHDMSIQYACDNVYSAANRFLPKDRADELKSVMDMYSTHVRASITAKIDLKNNSLLDIIPNRVSTSLYRIKAHIVALLFDMLNEDEIDESSKRWPIARAFHEMEKNGIFVAFDDSLSLSPAERSFVDDARSHLRDDGMVGTRFSFGTTKTGRVQTAHGSFKCMGIPRTPVRSMISSRFKGGSIASFDLNAADYRCIVSATKNDDLISLYDRCEDFHMRTVELVFGVKDDRFDALRRDVIKYVTHATNYGVSMDVLSKNTGLPHRKLDALREKMRFLSPVEAFRDDLFRRSMESGNVVSAGGRSIKLDGDEHPGKVLALYAQATVSDAFLIGVEAVHSSIEEDGIRSIDMFTVHDELVLDVFPGEEETMNVLASIMENAMSSIVCDMRVRVKIDKNYWEVSR